MINWTRYIDEKPPVGKKILLARRDFGHPKAVFEAYFAKLVHPALENPRYHPDWQHWTVLYDGKEQVYEIAYDDAWSELNDPEPIQTRNMPC